MKNLGSYKICLALLLLLLLGATATHAQEDVDSSSFQDQGETDCAIDDLPTDDEHWSGPNRNLTFTCRKLPRLERPGIEWTADVVGEHKKGGSPAEVDAPNKPCVRSSDAGVRASCFFSDQADEFVVPKHFTDKADDGEPKSPPRDRFHWRPALIQSMVIQGFQHGYALVFQEKMRKALREGPFFKDYINSVKALAGWDDGNRFFTNYVAHPAQGAMTGFIFVQNHDRVKRQKFGESKQYWMDRLTAFAWSTAWSTNWELGPISQSSLGNLGLKGGMAYVDLVITPTVGTAWLVAEEAIDRYIIRHNEKKNFLWKIALRTFLNPMRSVANALRLREPWYRDRPVGN